jgi:hypothetical protein
MNPGILILSSSLKVLYRNRQAERLVGHLDGRSVRSWSGKLPDSLVTFCNTVVQAHLQRGMLDENAAVTTRDSVVGSSPAIKVHGYGLPYPGSPRHAHLVIVLDEMSQ